jgi:glycerophosphoryl diester phosphodiesterase
VDDNVRTGLLVSDAEFAGALAEAAAGGHQAINPNREMVESDAVGAVRSADRDGLWVIPWTVDDPDEIRHLASAGVHGIITNDVRRALQALGR